MKKITHFAITILFFAGIGFAQDTDGYEDQKAPADFLDLFSSERDEKIEVMTQTAFVIAVGWNQALSDENGIGEDYRFWRSGFFDIGLEFSTRLNKDDDLLRLTYGLFGRYNSLHINDNKQFVTENRVTTLEPVGFETDRSKFRQGGFHIPLHLEIGRREVVEYEDGIKRYGNGESFVIGLGGYLGYTTHSHQEIKFEREGRDVTQTLTNDFEINNFNYGLSIYAGFEDIQLYASYGLNDIFKNSPIEQSYVTFGFRFR